MAEEPTTIETQVLESVSKSVPPRPCLTELGSASLAAVLRNRQNNPGPKILQHKTIPEEDLRVIEKIYWKTYPDCGRKRGALLRYIKEMKEKHEPETSTKEIIRLIERHR